MFTLEKSIDYITIPAILLDINKNIIHTNDLFQNLFNINNICEFIGKYITDDIFKERVENPNILDLINDDLENTHEKYLSVRGDEHKKWIRTNSLVFRNGTINYILLFENISDTHNIFYLYDQIFHNTNMGIVIITENYSNEFIIKDINPIACSIFHETKVNIINNKIEKYIQDENSNELYDIILEISKTGNSKEIKKFFSANKWYNINFIKVETGEIIMMIDDVTIETKALEKLEKSDKYKTEFLSNMSHEIRSPINSIIGFSELLKDDNNDKEKMDKYLNIIQNSSESLLKIVNDILDITKIEEGKLEINNSLFNLNPLMEELFLTINNNKNKNKDVKIKLSIPRIDTKISVDNFRLIQILNNIINNSLKFTKKGTIEFGYEITESEVKFFIKDTGIGIKKEDQIKIFERYSQAKINNKNKTIGHGLGLAISKELVILMGGNIYMDSEYNKGTSFYFSIPNIKKINNIKKSNSNSDYYSSDFSDKKILIVEDIEFNIRLLESYLENTNATLIFAVDGNDAILKYNENKNDLDLILMDIQLPEINGTDVTKIIRTIDKETPIIAQTAYVMKDEISEIMDYGFNDIIKKPIKKEELLKMIYKYI